MNAVQRKNLSPDEREHYFPEFQAHGDELRADATLAREDEDVNDDLHDAVAAMDEAIRVLENSRAIVEASTY